MSAGLQLAHSGWSIILTTSRSRCGRGRTVRRGAGPYNAKPLTGQGRLGPRPASGRRSSQMEAEPGVRFAAGCEHQQAPRPGEAHVVRAGPVEFTDEALGLSGIDAAVR